MGCADFYLTIYTDNNLIVKISEKLNIYSEYNAFNYLNSANKIEIECFFDNFIITNKILFSVLSSFRNNQDKIEIEANKIIRAFNFNSELEMFNWLFDIYGSKMDGYFKDYGFLSIPAKDYYKKRNKLKKYYKKLN